MDDELTPEELDRYAAAGVLTADEMRDVRRRALSAPHAWIVQDSAAAGPHAGPATALGPRGRRFVHRPTGARYAFAFAPRTDAWHAHPTPGQDA